jgi:predicted nucleic acid-binding protein
VTAFPDTSVLVRYLSGDPPDQAQAAAALIDSSTLLTIPIVALAETAYVLTSVYEIERSVVVDTLVEFLSRTNLEVHGVPKEHVIEALLLCRPSRRVSFADALIWATVRATPNARLLTFDRRFPTVGVTREVLR